MVWGIGWNRNLGKSADTADKGGGAIGGGRPHPGGPHVRGAGVLILWYGGSIAMNPYGTISTGQLITYQLYFNLINTSIQVGLHPHTPWDPLEHEQYLHSAVHPDLTHLMGPHISYSLAPAFTPRNSPRSGA